MPLTAVCSQAQEVQSSVLNHGYSSKHSPYPIVVNNGLGNVQLIPSGVSGNSNTLSQSGLSAAPVNTNPFFLKVISGNITMCLGCRSSLRNSSDAIPLPPYDLAIERFERRSYQDKTGTMQTPKCKQAAHYHLNLECVRAHLSLVVSQDIKDKLTSTHREFLRLVFGVVV